MDKGVVRHHASDGDEGVEYVPLPPGYTQEKAQREGMTCLKVLTDALHPHLRRDSYLYVNRMPISVIRDDNLVIYAEEGEPASVKEVELLPQGRILLKGLGQRQHPHERNQRAAHAGKNRFYRHVDASLQN